jgi:transcription elongation factor GreA
MSQIPRDRAAFGSIVTVRDLTTEEEQVFEVGLPDEADATPGLISASSPLGRALIGRGVGDEIVVQTPGGQRELEVTDLVTLHEREDEDGSRERGDA